MKVSILKNARLLDGELIYDQEILLEDIETIYLDYKPFHKEIYLLYTVKGKKYNIFNSDEIVLNENDSISIKE